MYTRAALTGLLVCGLAAPAVAQEYTRATFSGQVESVPAGTAAVIDSDRDDATSVVVLPFAFPYFGRLYDRVSVCSNGWLAFGTTSSSERENAALPSTAAPNALVAPLWDDLHTRTGSVSAFTVGTAPDRRFVVSWDGVDTFSVADGDDLTFQVHLHESTGVVDLVYADTGTWNGLSYTAGLEDDTGTLAFGAPGLTNDNAGQPADDQRFSPRVVTVTGRLERDRPVADATGLGNATETLDVRFADVTLVREDLGEVIARGRTASDGSFDVQALAVDAPLTLRVDVTASGPAGRVLDTLGATYTHTLASGVSAGTGAVLGTVTLDAAVDATSPSFRRALNIHQAAERGLEWALAAATTGALTADPPVAVESFPPLDFRWAIGVVQAGGSGYVPTDGITPASARINDAAANPDPYDDDVVLREYGHHVFATISSHPGPTSGHDWAGTSSEHFAFTDGFAHWFAVVVRGRPAPQFIDTTGADAAIVLDLEAATPMPARSPASIGAVASALWDLVDPAGEGTDDFAGTSAPAVGSTAAAVFAAIDISLDALPMGQTVFTVRDFFGAWRTDVGEIAGRRQTARIFIHHGAFQDDTREPNDLDGEEAVAGAGVLRLNDLRLSPTNEDRFRFEFTGATPSVLTASVQQTGTATVVLDVQLTRPDGTLLGLANNGTPPTAPLVQAKTTTAVNPGTYDVRVIHRGATTDTAEYSITLAAPLAVTTSAFPDWTVGVPFKQPVTVEGGVAPYAITLTHAVGGLAAAAGGTELAGTPSTAGDFIVAVQVDDAGAPQATDMVEVPLHVNPPLTLRSLLGVAAARAVDATVGTGGTTATWTAGGSSLPTGFTLNGGATLRLAGPATGPGVIEVVGDAFDVVGASLPATIGKVIVCPALADAGSSPVSRTATHLGVYFDGLQGSRVVFDVRFSGDGRRPLAPTILDATGAPVPLGDARIRQLTRGYDVRNLVLPSTGRFFAIFAQDADPLAGVLRGRVRIRPVTRGRGQVAILQPGQTPEVTVDAIGGSRLRIVVLRGAAPTDLEPTVDSVLGPDMQPLTLTRPRSNRRGTRKVWRGITLPTDGRYTLRLGGADDTTGPLSYAFRVRPPRRTRFSAD